LLEALWEFFEMAKVAKLNPLFVKFGDLFVYYLFKETEYTADLIARAIPVLGREAI